jgi:hypothetical protein
MTTRDVRVWAIKGWDRLVHLDAQKVRARVSEVSDSEALGVVAAGTFVGLRWMASATDRLGREAAGLFREVKSRRARESTRRDGAGPTGRAQA